MPPLTDTSFRDLLNPTPNLGNIEYARRKAKTAENYMKREDTLSDPLQVDKRIGALVGRHVHPKEFKRHGISKGEVNLSSTAAYESLFKGNHPLKGITDEIRSNINLMRSDKRFSGMGSNAVIDTAYVAALQGRLPSAYEHKFKTENSAPGFSRDTGPLPGYDQWVAGKRAEDKWEGTRRSFTPGGVAEHFAIGAAIGAASVGASKAITGSAMKRGSLYRGIKLVKKGTKFSSALRVAVAASRGIGTALPHPLAKIGLVGLAAIGEFALWNMGEDAIQSTDYARARQKEGRLDVTDLVSLAAGVAAMGGGTHVAKKIHKSVSTSLTRKEAEKRIFEGKADAAEVMNYHTVVRKADEVAAKKTVEASETLIDDVLSTATTKLNVESPIEGVIGKRPTRNIKRNRGRRSGRFNRAGILALGSTLTGMGMLADDADAGAVQTLGKVMNSKAVRGAIKKLKGEHLSKALNQINRSKNPNEILPILAKYADQQAKATGDTTSGILFESKVAKHTKLIRDRQGEPLIIPKDKNVNTSMNNLSARTRGEYDDAVKVVEKNYEKTGVDAEYIVTHARLEKQLQDNENYTLLEDYFSSSAAEVGISLKLPTQVHLDRATDRFNREFATAMKITSVAGRTKIRSLVATDLQAMRVIRKAKAQLEAGKPLKLSKKDKGLVKGVFDDEVYNQVNVPIKSYEVTKDAQPLMDPFFQRVPLSADPTTRSLEVLKNKHLPRKLREELAEADAKAATRQYRNFLGTSPEMRPSSRQGYWMSQEERKAINDKIIPRAAQTPPAALKIKTAKHPPKIGVNEALTSNDVEYLNSLVNNKAKIYRLLNSDVLEERVIGLKQLYMKWSMKNDIISKEGYQALEGMLPQAEIDKLARSVAGVTKEVEKQLLKEEAFTEVASFARMETMMSEWALKATNSPEANKIIADEIKERALKGTAEAVRTGKTLGNTMKLLGAAATIIPASFLFGADEAEAGVLATTGKMVGSTVSMMMGKENVQRLSKKAQLAWRVAQHDQFVKAGLIGKKGADPKSVESLMHGVSVHRDIAKYPTPGELLITTGGNKGGLGGFLDQVHRAFEPVMTMGARAGHYYNAFSSPAVEYASRMTASAANGEMFEEAMFNIIKDMPNVSKKSSKVIHDSMKVMQKDWHLTYEKANLSDANLKMAKSILEQTEGPYLRRRGKASVPPPDVVETIAKVKEDIATYTKELAEHKAVMEKVKNEQYVPMMKKLTDDHGNARVFLALEDEGFVKYPWLKNKMKPEEMAGVAEIKNLYDIVGKEMDRYGIPKISKNFVHHAVHPNFPMKEIKDIYKRHPYMAQKDMPYAYLKIHSRMENSLGMMPDIMYANQRYFPEIFKRMEMRDFWKSGWQDHAELMKANHPYTVGRFWNAFGNAMKPMDDIAINRIARTFYSGNVAWYLFASPSVAWKHMLKQSAQIALFGVVPWMGNVKASAKFAIKDKFSESYRLKGIFHGMGKAEGKEAQDLMHMFTTQGKWNNAIYDLNLQDMPKNVGDNLLYHVNKYGGIMVDTVERMDRGVSVLASLQQASKKGMTTQQAAFTVYDTILKTNFLSGALNPAWLRNPMSRAALMFAGTPYKIMEQRLIRTAQAAKGASRAWNEAHRQLEELGGLKAYVMSGEKQLKTDLIMGALNSEKDIFGTPYTHQFMRNILAVGGAAYIANRGFKANIWHHLIHLPVVEPAEGEIKLRTNPAFQAVVGASTRKRDDEMWLQAFFRHSLGRTGYVPATMNKALRLSNDDIPDIYRESKWKYLFSIPDADAGH